MVRSEWDVVVIGAGIHGAGVAQAAAARGYSVMVLEQYSEPARGTSSRSSKLIHGGLRYLEHGQIGLVNECLRERTILLRIAPDLVKLTPFYFPIYSTNRRGPLVLRAGLSLYALLGRMQTTARFSSLPAARWQDMDGLRQDGLRAIFEYSDAQTDDALLTRAVLDSAVQMNAEISYSAEVAELTLNDAGARVRYRQGGELISADAKVVVNAAGPWVNHLLERAAPQLSRIRIDLVQGTHIEISSLTPQGVYYLEAPSDGRAVFVMPWRGSALVGTTETIYNGDPGAVTPLEKEIDYLQRVVRHYFPNWSGQILDSFAGLRVLPAGGDRPFGRPRETVLNCDRQSQPRLITVYGGKLTAYRSTALRVVRKIGRSIASKRSLDTATIKLRNPIGGK